MKNQLYKENISSNYSKIISPGDYNKLMSIEHLYINAADMHIAKTIQEKVANKERSEVVEIGCGPARILPVVLSINPTIRLTGLDVDFDFLEYARNRVKDTPIKIIESDIVNYSHPIPVDIFYSEGFHHHIAKGKTVQDYLKNVHHQLKEGGYYIVGDEFIAEYKNEAERDMKLVLWYCHIIANAMKNGFDYLAREEAKTLLDDIYESKNQCFFKTERQIELVLDNAKIMDQLVLEDLEKANIIATSFLRELKLLSCLTPNGDDTIILSRGDYKISHSVFKQEIEEAGFEIESSKSFGPLQTIGAMVVYTLKKSSRY